MKKTVALNTLLLFLIHSFSYGQKSTYSGTYTSSTPISLNGVSNRTISNLKISNSKGNCITLTNCSNITIDNCKLGPSIGEGVSIEGCSNITVKYSSMESIRTGVYAVTSTGIKVEYNEVKNLQGPMPRGQMVQFDKVTGTGNSISYNVCENIAGKSNPEDAISLYQSQGTENDRIKIIGNVIRGGGPSNSGGGIMVGDNGGSYVLVENNILVNPGQYGISVTSGHNITVTNNKIYSRKFPFSNVGLYVWRQYEYETHTITISNNEINYTNKLGFLNNLWNAGNSGSIKGWKTNFYNSKLNESVLSEVIIGKNK
ncbi:MAG: right-handed parallel beta-helix repeat-containing protein [Paludibacter sp.]|nr:right-handed parallel beta-helix repeat-containing protein [Paludibacter sp.]